jgi:N-acetylglutamate synthase
MTTFKLEELMLNSWPALQTRHLDGFVLRSALGHTKRSNAASPLYPSTLDFKELSLAVRDHYRAQQITPMFRITDLAPVGLDDYLDAAGWQFYDPSQGMIFDIPERMKLGGSRDVMISLEDSPSPGWVEGAGLAYEFNDHQINALGMIVSQIRLTSAFCTVYLNKQPVGYGLAVYERGAVGLYDLAILPEFRGGGIGRRMVGSLIHWGKSKGASSAYLQARVANVKAIGLYESMGFRRAYLYHHRVWGK